jgi:hypothetical protein
MPLNNCEELAGGREEQAMQIASAATGAYFAIRVTNEFAPIDLFPFAPLFSAGQPLVTKPGVTRHRSTPALEQS